MENEQKSLLQAQKNEKGINIPTVYQFLKNGTLKCKETATLSKYAKNKIATNEQIKDFIKALIVIFPNQNDLFWQIVAKELVNQQPAYKKLIDMYKYFLKEFPYRTLTAHDILGFNENIPTFDVIQLGAEMDKNPYQAFAAIKTNNAKCVYATLEDAQKTNLDYKIIKPLKETTQNN